MDNDKRLSVELAAAKKPMDIQVHQTFPFTIAGPSTHMLRPPYTDRTIAPRFAKRGSLIWFFPLKMEVRTIANAKPTMK